MSLKNRHRVSELGFADIHQGAQDLSFALARVDAELGKPTIVVNAATAPRMADYATAKYALLGPSKVLAIEWADDHIRVNMISPGLVQTELTQHYHDKVFKMEDARTPLKSLATPVAFLVSDEASYLTGVNPFVTGGQVML